MSNFPFPVSEPQTWIHQKSGNLVVVYWFTEDDGLLSFPRDHKDPGSFGYGVGSDKARAAASLDHTFKMRDYCFMRKDNNGKVIYKLCQSSPEYLTSVGYTLQSAEDSPTREVPNY
jgi:hypothetical protein